MGFDDLLDFDASSYAAKMRGLSTPELKAREEEKARQFLSGSCSLGIGAGALAATGGISALWMGFSARNMDVAYKKLGIIQVEFTRRGVPLKDGVNEADKKVAVVGGLTSFLVGGAVQEGLGDGGMAEGATPSFGEVAPANFAAGFAGGVSRDFMERFDTKEWREDIRRALGCKRLAGIWPGAHTVFCDPCGENIEEGLFAHCCECDNTYDVCHSCYSKGLRCHQAAAGHTMAYRQVAVDGLSERQAVKRMLRLKSVQCDSCRQSIRQGRLYACGECNKGAGGFDLCSDCYFNGATCLAGREHVLFVFLAAFNPTHNESAYTKTHGSGMSRCDNCSNDITQGHYFQCRDFTCRTRTECFDTCYWCHEKGLSCQDITHKLSLILAYGHTRQERHIYNGTAFCDVCERDMKDDYWLHCSGCRGGNFDLCPTCVYVGWRCLDASHALDRVISNR